MNVILILGICFPNASVKVVYLANYVVNQIKYLIYSAKINNILCIIHLITRKVDLQSFRL